MHPTHLIAKLHSAGLSIQIRDGKLLVSPAERLTDKLRTAIEAGKQGLLDFLNLRELDRDLEDLLAAAARVCDFYGDGEQGRADMRADCMDVPLHQRADLLDHFNSIAPLRPSIYTAGNRSARQGAIA